MSTDSNTNPNPAGGGQVKRDRGRPPKESVLPPVPLAPPKLDDPPTVFPLPSGVIGPDAPDLKGSVIAADLGNVTFFRHACSGTRT
jgi:hypothetical protein